MVVLYLLVQNNGDRYVYQQYPDFSEDIVSSVSIQGTVYEQTIPFSAHDIEYMALRFDVNADSYDYAGSEITISLFQESQTLGSWTILPSQIPNIYYYYLPVNLHRIPAGDLTLRIMATGEAPIGLYLGNAAEGISADYIMVFDSYSRSKLLLLAFGITILLFLFYALFCQGKSIERNFVFLYVSLGILYFLVCPILSEPDAKNHYCRAYEVSEGTWISPVNAEGDAENSFSIPEGWATESDSMNLSLYETWYQRDFQITEDTKVSYQYNNMALYSPVSYVAQAIGFAIARLFSRNFLFSVMLARGLNFLFAGILFYLAILLTPVGKKYIVWISMLPMGLELAASISSDAVVTALVCLLVALVCRYRYTDKQITLPEMVLLYAVALLLSQYKIVYVVFCLLLFLIPQKAFGGKRGYITHALTLGTLVAAASLVWLHISGSFLESHFTLSNYQKDYILHNPHLFVLALINTVLIYGADLLKTMVGSHMGALSFTTNAFLVMLLLICLLIWILRDRFETEAVEKAETGEMRKKADETDVPALVVMIVVTLLASLLIVTSEYLQWNDVGEKAVGGLQGRYFLPLLYPVLLVLGRSLNAGTSLSTEEANVSDRWVPILLGINLCFVMQLFLHFVY
ncbi:MAG: DUF2142 domain-containing protein [Lachnospiraceae bacterium]|nr:DUF2142 domain-containing protein [Lachnospiraceae bacterium]